MRLRPRLSAAASLVRGGGVLADIGTDHAYLPVWLLENGRIAKAIASDIGEGPLANAARTVNAYGFASAVELRLSNGLEAYRSGEADEIVICGMGGTLIAGILGAAPWVRDPALHLVLQPMSHAQDVRRWLCLNGFSVEKELCVADGGRVYLTLSAVYTNAPVNENEGYHFFGSLLNAPGEAAVFVQRQRAWAQTRLRAIEAAGRYPEEQAMLRRVLAYYRENGGTDES